jgi:hypothetical protein
VLALSAAKAPALVTLTALYLPADRPCCPFHTTNDSVPGLRIDDDTKLPLGVPPFCQSK